MGRNSRQQSRHDPHGEHQPHGPPSSLLSALFQPEQLQDDGSTCASRRPAHFGCRPGAAGARHAPARAPAAVSASVSAPTVRLVLRRVRAVFRGPIRVAGVVSVSQDQHPEEAHAGESAVACHSSATVGACKQRREAEHVAGASKSIGQNSSWLSAKPRCTKPPNSQRMHLIYLAAQQNTTELPTSPSLVDGFPPAKAEARHDR
jgi:hypothetical protein